MLAKILDTFVRIRQIQQTLRPRSSFCAERLFFQFGVYLSKSRALSSTTQRYGGLRINLNSYHYCHAFNTHISHGHHQQGTDTSLEFSQATWCFFAFTHCLLLKIVLCSRSLFFDLISIFALVWFVFLFTNCHLFHNFFWIFIFHLSLLLWKLYRNFRRPYFFERLETSNFSRINRAKNFVPYQKFCQKLANQRNFSLSDTRIDFVQQSFDSVTNKSWRCYWSIFERSAIIILITIKIKRALSKRLPSNECSLYFDTTMPKLSISRFSQAKSAEQTQSVYRSNSNSNRFSAGRE